MKNVLVVYYSQTGQLAEILNNFLLPMSADYHVDYAEIKTSQYTFPLTWKSMFEMFPESVLQMSCEISYELPKGKDYDIIILGFQTWFLHLSLPMLAFSGTQDFCSLIKDKDVYLVMDCRNSWRPSMEYMENRVLDTGGIVKGRYVFGSAGGNLSGSISILHWFFTGNKKLPFFTEPGVPQSDIEHASEYGTGLLCCHPKDYIMFYPLNTNKFLPIEVEQYAIDKFKRWAHFIAENNNKNRTIRLFLFKAWLLCTIVIISPKILLLKNKQ